MATAVGTGGRVGLPMPLGDLSATRWDAVVVGAGHNGLVAAAYLARANKRVLVLERMVALGGAATRYEIWPGYFASPARLVGLLHPTVISDLDLQRFGYRVTVTDPQLSVPIAGGPVFVEWLNRDRTVDGLRSWAPDQVKGYLAYEGFWDMVRARLRPESEDDLWLSVDPPSRAEVERRLEGDPDAIGAIFEWSQMQLLERFFSDHRLIDACAGQGMIGTNASPRDPGTASMTFHHSGGSVDAKPGVWGFVGGGMGNVSFAIADAAATLGVVIAAGVPVARILPERGVELESGELVSAPVVVANADPLSVVRLLGEEAPSQLIHTVGGQSQDSATFKVTYGLATKPVIAGGEGAWRGRIRLTPGVAAIHSAHRAATRGEMPNSFWGELLAETESEASNAPPGKHIVSCLMQYAPYSFSGSSWAERRDALVALLTSQIEVIAPGFGSTVEHVRVDIPRDLENRYGLTGGHIFHGSCLPDHMWDRRVSYRTGVSGVYMCGAGTYPGGGVIGINGRNAALAVLRDAR